MRDGVKDIFVLCDAEEEYARLMTDYLKAQREVPWEIHTYTSVELLAQGEQNEDIAMLVVAESTYTEALQGLRPLCTVILNESGVLRWGQLQNINKYQQADYVLKSLLQIYLEVADSGLPRLAGEYHTTFVGMYSPVRRCMQTTFALTMSQMLAETHRTLYLNFEHYVGITDLLPDMQTRDLADLLYFLNSDQERFRLRLQTMIMKKGNLDYVPPMRSGQNLLTISAGEWMQLLRKIAELGEYEFVILDLSESMQGLFELLRCCKKVFTLTKEDHIAQSKIMQYEQILALYEYGDVLEKTCKCSAPKIRKLPEAIEQYTRGELAKFVREQMKEFCDL